MNAVRCLLKSVRFPIKTVRRSTKESMFLRKIVRRLRKESMFPRKVVRCSRGVVRCSRGVVKRSREVVRRSRKGVRRPQNLVRLSRNCVRRPCRDACRLLFSGGLRHRLISAVPLGPLDGGAVFNSHPKTVGLREIPAPNLPRVCRLFPSHCAWAKAFYDEQRRRNKRHHTAVRALAFKWVGILFACWKHRTPYQDALYNQALQKNRSAFAGG
jgi:hypothetical protein